MCQIIKGPSAQLKQVLLNTPGLLEELHRNNPDGWGALYYTRSAGAKAIKTLPKSAEDTRKSVQKLPDDDREVALHWRWKTSGLIDKENAHPHHVEGGWLIHNGVLDVDCSADEARCDTHHFARQYLDGSVGHLVQAPKLLALLGEFIGNNRFVLMCDAGTMAVVNAHQGYMAQGLWFANDYSMDRGLVDPTYCRKITSHRGIYGGFNSTTWTGGRFRDSLDDWGMDGGSAREGFGGLSYPAEDMEGYDITYHTEAVDEAIDQYDTATLGELMEEDPELTLGHIFAAYDVTEYERVDDGDMDKSATAIRARLLKQDAKGLIEMMDISKYGSVETKIAETLLFFCVLDEKVAA